MQLKSYFFVITNYFLIFFNQQSVLCQTLKTKFQANESIVFFNKTDTNIFICNDISSISIDRNLQIKNQQLGKYVTWYLLNKPKYGFVYYLDTSLLTTTFINQPFDLIYEPDGISNGVDSLLFACTDNYITVFKKIIVHINEPIKNNIINSSFNVCTLDTPIVIGAKLANNISYRWQSATSTDSTRFYNQTNTAVNYMLPIYPHLTKRWIRRIATDGVCDSYSNVLPIQFLTKDVWIGKMDSNWHNIKNWCSSLFPTGSNHIYISSNAVFNPSILKDANINNITIENNKQLNILAQLNLFGNIYSKYKNINCLNGTIQFMGDSIQYIAGSNFINNTIHNLIINNNATINTNYLFVKNKLHLVSGKLYSNDSIYLIPTTKVLFNNNADLLGNITIKNGLFNVKQRFYGHPFKTIYNITNVLNPALNNFNFYYFTSTNNELQPSIIWKKVNPTNLLNWAPLTGLKIESNQKIAYNDSFLLDITGVLNRGNIEINMQNKTFNLMANPYNAQIDLSKISVNSNISNYYWVWENTINNNGFIKCIPADEFFMIKPFESFFIKSNQSYNNNILFTEQIKLLNNETYQNPINYEANKMGIGIQLLKDENVLDQVYVFIDDKASNMLDYLDGEKLFNDKINLYIKVGGSQFLSIDKRPYSSNFEVPIEVDADTSYTFQFKINQQNMNVVEKIYLYDKLLNIYQPITKNSRYNFVYSPVFKTKEARFYITNFIQNVHKDKFDFSIYPNPLYNDCTIKYIDNFADAKYLYIISTNGTLIYSKELGNLKEGELNLNLSYLTVGIYYVLIKNSFMQKSISIVKL